MKKIFLLYLTSVFAIAAFAQKETFDLTTYTTPKGWKKQPVESAVQFSKEDAVKGTYCMITLYKSVPGTANSKENFDLAWASVVKEMVTVSAAPEMQPAATENGWETQSGYAPFESDGNKGIVILVTSSGSQKMVNLIILTNTDVYEKEMTGFLESVSLKKIETSTQQIQTPASNNNNAPILGTWAIGSSDQSGYAVNNGINGYIKRQYTFNANGTYIFIIKTFQYTSDKLLLTKENGTYQISGNNITVSPQKSVIEAWSKKDGVDKWGKLLSSQNRTLEKTTYQFTKHYFSGIQLWNLVLQAGKVTQRDGPFSTNTTFTNAWYYAPVSANNTIIELPGGQQIAMEEIKKESVQQTTGNGFAFTTSNFDDGWNGVIKNDWVEVSKGSTIVLLHFGITMTDEMRIDITTTCWNRLAATKYNIKNLYPTVYSVTKDFPYYFIQADASEKSTGNNVFVSFRVIPKNGVAYCYEIINSTRNEFQQQFPVMDKIENMSGYNRFAIGKNDLIGTWQEGAGAFTQYYFVSSGNYAGMNITVSNLKYIFANSSAYSTEVKAVNNNMYKSEKENGKYSVSNWEVSTTDQNGKNSSFSAWFESVKGGRILHLLNKKYSSEHYQLGKVK